jgi:hypothetical protein
MRRTYISRDVFAGCFECNGSEAIWWTKNAQGVAARHHDATGHTTWVEVNMSIKYGDGARMTASKATRNNAAKAG